MIRYILFDDDAYSHVREKKKRGEMIGEYESIWDKEEWVMTVIPSQQNVALKKDWV